MVGMDEISRICINGPRVTEMIAKLVPNIDTFRLALRIIRYWAKQRAVYSNKLGFLGGVNWSILTVFTCQLYPKASPAVILEKFFEMYCVWRWPTPVYLVHPYNVHNMEDVSNWEQRPIEQMPIITPAFPTMNSSFNVTKANLQIMLKEFQRGRNFCRHMLQPTNEKVWLASKEKSNVKMNSAEESNTGALDLENQENDEWIQRPELTANSWSPLFSPNEFFNRYNDFIVITAKAAEKRLLDFWSGYVESRVRIIIHELDRFNLLETFVYPYKFSQTYTAECDESFICTHEVNKEETQKSEQDSDTRTAGGFCNSWFVGIRPHPVNSMRPGGQIDLTSAAAQWKMNVETWSRWTEEMGLDIKHVEWKGKFLFSDGFLLVLIEG